jgi:UDP-glucuronate 4-epimerase
MRKVLVTGGAGFIGSNLVRKLLAEGEWQVTNLDNFDPFYDKSIKEKNLADLLVHPNHEFVQGDIRDADDLSSKLHGGYDVIVHLAAKAGVRPSLEDPAGFMRTNVEGTLNMLELAKEWGTKQFVFASSSSVYGVNPNVPWSEEDNLLQPISPYASTKIEGELMGNVYSKLHGIRFIGLRFFTVYGPGQRPDLAIHKFTRMIMEGKTIPVFGDGSTRRDYTFVDDILQGIRASMDYTESEYEIINLGNHNTVQLHELISAIENVLGKEAVKEVLPEQPGDVPQTFASVEKAKRLLGYEPTTNIDQGLPIFRDWIMQLEAAN